MKRLLSLVLALILCLSMLAGCAGPAVGGDEDIASLGGCVDENGRLIARRGTPTASSVNGKIDKAWKKVEATELTFKDRFYVPTKATVKTLWDDEFFYILVEVTDADVNPEKDVVTVNIDTLWDKSGELDGDDWNFTILPNCTSDMMSGDGSFSFNASVTDKGYAVEASVDIASIMTDGWVAGFEVIVSDYDASGAEVGELGLFSTPDLESAPCDWGEIIFEGDREAPVAVSTAGIEKMIKRYETTDYTSYGGYENITATAIKLRELLNKTDLTVEDVVMAMEKAHEVRENLVDASAFPDVADIEWNDEYPDPFVFLDGGEMKSKADWEARRKEISDMYQYYMYGVWRDGTDEIVTYDYNNGTLTVYIERISTGAKTQFTATVMMPEESVKAPSDAGYPVVVGMHMGISEQTANAGGFATITLDWFAYGIASDDTKHTGAFYDLYPYGKNWQDQTGVLMAWSWGCSKILDALEAGLGEELGIDPHNSVVTGVSRWGKAASVAGAFDDRFTMVAPSCSGAGGLALFRYTSKGKTYDFTSKGESGAYTYGDNEPLGSLQSAGEVGWFCDNFKKFKSATHLPFDQYMLASLPASKDRMLFIIGSCVWEDWVNAPAMWYTYLGAKEIYTFLGLEDNIKINIHTSGHAVIEEDMQYMTEYFKEKVYGIKPESDLSVLDSSVFALEQNADPKMEGYTDSWIHNFM